MLLNTFLIVFLTLDFGRPEIAARVLDLGFLGRGYGRQACGYFSGVFSWGSGVKQCAF